MNSDRASDHVWYFHFFNDENSHVNQDKKLSILFKKIKQINNIDHKSCENPMLILFPRIAGYIYHYKIHTLDSHLVGQVIYRRSVGIIHG